MIDSKALGQKLFKYRQQLAESTADVAIATGLLESDLLEIEAGRKLPNGDELLILADHFLCDYKFFLSNEKTAPFEQTEILFRRYGDELGKADRRAIQELLFLCEVEDFVQEGLHRKRSEPPKLQLRGKFFKDQGRQAARQIRSILGYAENEAPADPFRDFRRLGIHVFRRPLDNSRVSGLFVDHPKAGRCVLVNYVEDAFRQRFTVSHEAAHALLDADQQVSLSYQNEKGDAKEWRANAFASAYLLPDGVLSQLSPSTLTEDSVQKLCLRLMVNPVTLAIAMKDKGHLDDAGFHAISAIKLPRASKQDTELIDLSELSAARKQTLLSRGLSSSYINLCFEAHRQGVLSLARLSEVLLCDIPQTVSLMESIKEVPVYAD